MKKFILPVLILALLPALSVSQQNTVSLPDSAYTHPPASCSICAGSLWINENNAKLFDSQYTETELMPNLFCFQSLCYRSRYLGANNFEMNIPSNATITGIFVTISGFSSHPFAVRDSTVRLTKNYDMVGNNLPDTASWSTQDMNRTYGVGSNLWGTTWTVAEVNDPGFGVFYKVYNISDSTPVFKVDVVEMTVQYTTPQGTFSVTSEPKQFRSWFDVQASAVNVTFEPQEPGDYQFQVLNISGTVVHEEKLSALSLFEKRISAVSFAPGIYFVRFTGKTNQYVRKFPVSP